MVAIIIISENVHENVLSIDSDEIYEINVAGMVNSMSLLEVHNRFLWRIPS